MEAFTIQKNNIFAVPVIHYTMELAMQVKMAFDAIQPDCVAVELPESMEKRCLQAASRLPDISVLVCSKEPLYYLCEPCEATFEGLRLAIENKVAACCIDRAVKDYPLTKEILPDPYSTVHIGLKDYYTAYLKTCNGLPKHPLDREGNYS